MEGVTLFVKTSNRALRYSGRNKSKLRNQKLVLGWGLPALIVIVGAIAGFTTETYMKNIDQYGYSRCWLDPNNAVFYVTVLAPMAVIYVINMLMFFKILHFVYGMSKSSVNYLPSDKENELCKGSVDLTHIRVAMKSFGLLFPVLGFPYLFAFLSGNFFNVIYLRNMLQPFFFQNRAIV